MKMKNKLLTKVFGWLFIGLLITFASGYLVSINQNMMRDIFSSYLYWIFVVAELGLAIFLRVRITKMSKTTAMLCYIIYTILTGLTISIIFVSYKLPSIMIKLGVFLMIGVIAIILLAIINLFVGSEKLNIFTCIIGVVIFIGYVAYDVNKIVKASDYEEIEESNYPIVFALELYIDFINLFLDLLRLFGDSNN